VPRERVALGNASTTPAAIEVIQTLTRLGYSTGSSSCAISRQAVMKAARRLAIELRRSRSRCAAGSNRGLGCAVRFATCQQLDQFVEGRVPCHNSLPR
jgi:hypothetical protein